MSGSVGRKIARKVIGKKRKAVKKPKKKDNIKTGDKVKFKRKYEAEEGMGRDPITGRDVGPASDVDKGKAGRVTRSAEPGFLQQERTAGSRAKAREKVELAKKVREGEATKAEKAKLKRLRQQDELDTVRAQTKGAQTRRGRKKPADDFATAINRKTGEINEEAFNRLTKNQQQALMRDIRARFSTTRAREIQARIDELEPTKAGETGVRRRRQGQTYGMRGANRDDGSRIKDIDEGVSRGRGGLDFRKGGKVTKRAIGSMDFRKGGMVLSTIDNRKRKK
tara:strand:- start:743 stop:1582 length:840 start_codon:yes stop_codon:yes gene_type:complete